MSDSLPRKDLSRTEYAVRYWEGENGRWERVLPAESLDDAHNFIRYLEKREEQIREVVTPEEFARYDFTRELLTRTVPHWTVIE
ncbi:hypothetical protein [Rhodococcoides fascians]|uniref:hypothetical protein n=1 Tax=Rhodococcoides fascians TaxID=1828 RepID=UPI00050C2215|nr:hypothetical protein [Rhodococcus fascians]